jgi:hypothetical protein
MYTHVYTYTGNSNQNLKNKMGKTESHQSRQYLQNISSSASFFSDHVYTPEIILTSWFNLSFGSMMLAMVFYGIAIHKNLAHHVFIELIALSLIATSIYYTYNGYMQYNLKMKYAIDACRSNESCSTINLNVIGNNKKYVMVTSIITITIDALIAIVIVYKSYKKLTSSSR